MTALQMAVLVVSQMPGWDIPETFVCVHIADVLCNLLSVYYLSGLADANRMDVLGEFAHVGDAARVAALHGFVGIPMESAYEPAIIEETTVETLEQCITDAI